MLSFACTDPGNGFSPWCISSKKGQPEQQKNYNHKRNKKDDQGKEYKEKGEMEYFIRKKVYCFEKEGENSSGDYRQEKRNGKSKGGHWKEKTALYCYCKKCI